MHPKKQIAVKISILSLAIFLGLTAIVYGQFTASSFPEASISFEKMLPNNMGNVVVIMNPQKAFVVDDTINAIVAVSLSNDYVNDHKIHIVACFPDALASQWQDLHFPLTESKRLNEYGITYFEQIDLRYVSDGIYGLNVTITNLGLPTTEDTYSYPAIVKINPLTYLTEKERSDSAYTLNYEILGLSIIMLAPIFVQLFSLLDKAREKARKKETGNYVFVGDGR